MTTMIRNMTSNNQSNQSRIITRRLHSLVMVGIDAHFIFLEVKCILACINGPQLMVAVKVGPSPQTAVDDMGQALTMRHLKTPVQRPEMVNGENSRELNDVLNH